MDIFSRFGTVTNIRLIRNKRGATKGYCFLSFLTPQGVENAINSENIWLRNRLISIRKMKAGVQLKNLRD
jgi:RNA recognition motif-containing protein